MEAILFRDIAVIDGVHEPRQCCWVLVRNGVLERVAENPAPQERDRLVRLAGPKARSIDGRGLLLTPGLVNAHAHVPMTLLRGRGENLALDAWLNTAIFPFEAHITDEDAYWASLLGMAEMARFGTVSFSDMYYNSNARARAVVDAGMKANLCCAITCFDPDAGLDQLPGAREMRSLLDRWQGAGDGRLVVDASLHAEYTSTPRVATQLADFAKEHGLIMHVHVSETEDEMRACKERHGGMTPVRYLESCGLFDVPSIAAHCVWLEPEDAQILARRGVTAALNPSSNAKLGSGIADVTMLHEAGVKLALGTDGVASNNNHDLHRALYLLALMQRARDCSPVGLSSRQAIHAATRAGALAQGRTDAGVIEEGARADLAVFDLDTPWMQPQPDLESGFVYSMEGSDALMTLVDGRVVHDRGEFPTIDVERAAFETTRARDRIVSTLAENR